MKNFSVGKVCVSVLLLLDLTHSTRLSSPRGRVESTGFRPVMSSRSTTPKENTSDFSVSFPVEAYSGAKYLYSAQVQN
jgi:hypothetical protein